MRSRLAVVVFLVLSGASVVAYATARATSARLVRIDAERSLASAAALLAAVEQAEIDTLDATLTRILSDARVLGALAKRDRERLASLLLPVFRDLELNHGIDFLNLLLPDRTVFFRAHRPGEFGDVPTRPVLVEAAERGEVAVGRDLGRSGYALRLVRPLAHGGGRAGFIEIGQRSGAGLRRMRELTDDDYAIVVAKRSLDRAAWAAARGAEPGKDDRWDALPEAVVVDGTWLDGTLLRGWSGGFATIPRNGFLIERSEVGERSFAVGVVPIWNAAGEWVGGLVVRHETTESTDAMAAPLRHLALALALVTLVGSVVLAAVARGARVAHGAQG